MAINLPHNEELGRTFYLPPVGSYETFADEIDYLDRLKEWGLASGKTAKSEFWYKDKDHQRKVKIIGYQVYGETAEHYTVIIEFADGNLSCIHPAYLKEMQAGSFGKAPSGETEKDLQPLADTREQKQEKQTEKVAAATPKPGKPKKPKIELPAEKVHFTATVKQFALSWNHFNEENDEVVVLEGVAIEADEPLHIGLAWCSHSKTLKKHELAPGDTLEFDGKIVKKKLPKGKDADEAMILEEDALYKINNPSKIKKQ